MTFDTLPSKTFEQLPLGAGVLCDAFNPKEPTISDEAILGATSGGSNFSAVPTYIDRGEGIDNCPHNVAELKDLDAVDVKLSGTFATITPKLAQMLAGAADLSESKIVPRKNLKISDFKDLWLVADYGKEGGMIAVHLMNALSTGGLSLQTADKDKDKFSFEFTAHTKMQNADTVPYEMYVSAASPAMAAASAPASKGKQ